MPSFADLRAYAGFAAGVGAFLRRRETLEGARETVRRRLRERPAMLLALLRHGIYGNAASPYRALLAAAGCELGDVERLVSAEGVEGALAALRRAGVYVAFEELKGRRPIVRGGIEIEGGIAAFANPRSARFYHGATGGSTGRPSRIRFDLDHMAATQPGLVLAMEVQGVRDVPAALWRPILPSVAGLSSLIRGAARGRPAERWFSPLSRRDLPPSAKDRLATAWVLAASRLAGVPLPRPETVPFADAAVVARWVRDALDREGRCLLQSGVSAFVRVALAAGELGLDLGGAVFWGGGEPPTEARVAAIRASGARFVPTYYLSEAGAVGLACGEPADGTDVHLMADALALIEHPVAVPGTGPPGRETEVAAIHLTSLLPTSPLILLNVETDDFGIVDRRRCGCLLGELGLDRHLRQVASYRKLTGEGMSLVGSDAVRILEEVLPARFGGSPLDYQLVEESDSRGLVRLALRVHPRLGPVDPEAVLSAVREALAGGDPASALAAAVWAQAGSFVVRREAPETTAAGKLLPLRVRPATAEERRQEVAS